MNIEEAIERLYKHINDGYYDNGSPIEKAIRLGIEALELVKMERKGGVFLANYKLRGETEYQHLIKTQDRYEVVNNQ